MEELKVQIIGAKKLRVLDLVNRFGVIANKQIFDYFDGEITRHNIYKILQEFEKMGVISKGNIGRIFYVYIRPLATPIVSEPMYKFNKVNQIELLHDLRVSHYIIEQYKKQKNNDKYKRISFITERELIDNRLIEKEDELTDSNATRTIEKLKRHLSDGIIITENHEGGIYKLAIEYELTQKAKRTYEKVLRSYQLAYDHQDITAVLYIVKGRRIQRKIEQVRNEQNYNFRIVFRDADEVFE